MSSTDPSIIEATTERLRQLAPNGQPFPIREPLQTDECRWFNRAIDDEVVSFRECPDHCGRFKDRKAKGPDHFVTPDGKARHLFSAPDAPEAWLNREYVPHLAAYARAILDFGYSRKSSTFSLYRSYRRDLLTKKAGKTYETDAEFYDAAGNIHLQIEAKAKPSQVATIVRQLDATPDLAELPPGTAKEIEYVLDLEPAYLWIVGPGSIDPAAHVYSVRVDGLNAVFTPVPGLPPAPV